MSINDEVISKSFELVRKDKSIRTYAIIVSLVIFQNIKLIFYLISKNSVR